MLELKPCPFCGKDAQIAPDEIGSGGQHVPPYHAGCLRGAGCGIAFTADDPDEAIAEWNRRATLSSAAVAERVPVAAWQFKHHDPISGNPVWKSTLYWNGHRATESRPLYLDPPPTSELEAENARLRADLAAKDAASTQWRDALDSMHRRALEAEAALAEARKALDAVSAFFKCIRFDRDKDWIAAEAFDAVRAARRAREQGGENG